jgi:hypothetical protein
MNRNMKCSLVACVGALLWLVGCGSDDNSVETTTEQLTPVSNSCVTSDTCPYGHCTTEDGVCARDPNCTPNLTCPMVACYGSCVASPSSR